MFQTNNILKFTALRSGLLFLFFSMQLSTVAQEEVFSEANELYNQEQYTQAIEKYEAILNAKKHSAELYYNMGNAYYKTDQLGQAIYYFEKALRLAPDDEDIQNNLAFAKNQTIDVITPLPKVGFNALVRKVGALLSVNSWAIFAIISAFLVALCYLLYAYAHKSFIKRIYFTAFLFSIFAGAFALSFAFIENTYQKNHREAIVFSLEVQVKNEPLENSETSFLLHEGTKVQVLESADNWFKIKLADGKLGWMQADNLKLFN
ncbi:MAG: tetratricopeptide repeat protein [Flavobacteriaceae bacterium]|nr:tetratricopeptide repeat protein [Flavobacteriaceae bacterium]